MHTSQTDDENERNSSSVEIPRWVLLLVIAILLNIGSGLFSAGFLWSKVNSLEKALDNLGNRFDRFEETRGLPHGSKLSLKGNEN